MRRPRYTGEAAVYEAVRRLQNEFEYPDEIGTGGAFVPSGGGGAPTVVVAASDASDLSKSKADFVCTGVNDHDVIQAAIDQIQTAVTGGRVLLTEGTFSISTGEIDLDEDIWLQGMGFRTVIETTDSSGVMITTGNECQVSDLLLLGPSGNDTTVGIQGSATANNRIVRVYFNRMNTAINDPGDRSLITGCWSVSTIEFLTADSQAEIQIIGNTQVQTITITSTGTVSGIQITDNILEGQISISDVDGFVIADNTWTEVNGSNDFIITLNTVTDGVISGNATADGGGYDTLSLTSGSGIVITSNIWDNIVAGIFVTSSDKCRISDNTLGVGGDDYLGEHGIEVVSSSNCQILDNMINQPGQNANNTYDAIIISGASNRNLIQGNTLIGAAASPQPRYGVNVGGTGECNMVVGNDLGDPDDYGTDALEDTASNTQLTYPNDMTYGDNFTDCGSGS